MTAIRSLLDELKQLIAIMVVTEEHLGILPNSIRYWYYTADKIPFVDFTKQIVEPCFLSESDDGYIAIKVGVRCYTVAILPYRFHEMPIAAIVKILWPCLDEVIFGEDIVLKWRDP